MHPDSTLFEIYSHPDSVHRFGVSNAGGEWSLVEYASGAYKRKRVTALVGTQRLAQKLKAGYGKSKSRMYFSEAHGTFNFEHPDLASRWVLAVAPPNLEQCIGVVTGLVKSLPSTVIYPEEVDAWAAIQAQHSEYVVAGDDLCLWALVIAEASLNEGWPLRWNGSRPLPTEPPSLSPNEWQEWLASTFLRKTIQETQRTLGWTFERRLTSVENPPTGSNLAALF